MSRLTIIEKILNAKFKPDIQNCLIEENIDNRSNKFTVNYNIINNKQTNYLLYRFEKEAFPFFQDVSGLKKSCDYILFAESFESFYVFVIELKKGTISAEKQLLASEEFVKFIINSADRIGLALNSNKDIEIRRIRICDKKLHRTKTKMKDTDFEYIQNYCDYKYNQIYLAPLMKY